MVMCEGTKLVAHQMIRCWETPTRRFIHVRTGETTFRCKAHDALGWDWLDVPLVIPDSV